MKTYHIITIGCQMNKSDSERIAAYLQERGYKESDLRNRADLVVLVTCGVRQTAEDRIYGLAPKIKKENPKAKIILTGCLSGREDVRRRLKNKVDIWLNIFELPNLINLINSCKRHSFRKGTVTGQKLRGRTASQAVRPLVADSIENNCGYLDIKPKHQSKFSAFVPIGNGCDNFCTYCVVPYARGREAYRPAREIINEVKDLARSGCKEIILIAQNVNSYKAEIPNSKTQIPNPPALTSLLKYRLNLLFAVSPTVLRNDNRQGEVGRGKSKIKNSKKYINFPGLLKIINDIQGDFWIRFSTSHPKDMSDELIKTIAQCEKVCRHIHLPAQAGDDEVLKKMNRKYNTESYEKLVGKIKKVLNFQFPISHRFGGIPPAINIIKWRDNFQKNAKSQITNSKYSWKPPIAITTDIIVGFPGETKMQFNNTARLLKKIKFDMGYISRYSPRPGTPAAKLTDSVPKAEKKKREEELMKILRKTSLENNKEYVGKVVKVLIEGKNKRGEWYGKTETSKVVKLGIKNQELGIRSLEGEFIAVKIKNANDFGFEGEIYSAEF